MSKNDMCFLYGIALFCIGNLSEHPMSLVQSVSGVVLILIAYAGAKK